MTRGVRTVVVPGGEVKCPPNIQRLDFKNTHGWQARWGGKTKFVPDAGLKPKGSLLKAKNQLRKLVLSLSTPTNLRKGPQANKSNSLPAGISGPILESRPERGSDFFTLSVLEPRYRKLKRVRKVWIGTIHTISKQRYDLAVEKAILLRSKFESQYRADVKEFNEQHKS